MLHCYVHEMARLEDLRHEARNWIDQNWDPDLTVAQWWQLMADGRWQFPTWPEGLGGRGLTSAESRAVSTEVV